MTKKIKPSIIFRLAAQSKVRDSYSSSLETIKTNSKPRVTFEDGRKALIIANAAYEAFENKKTIDINYD